MFLFFLDELVIIYIALGLIMAYISSAQVKWQARVLAIAIWPWLLWKDGSPEVAAFITRWSKNPSESDMKVWMR